MKNPYTAGAFAPINHEYTLTLLNVTGSVPQYLDGRYLRNGPNPIGEIDPARYHWFMGEGMVHGVRLRDGQAEWYRNRWVRPTGDDVREKLGANTNIIGHAGKTLALVEGGLPCYELTEELETIGAFDFGGTITAGYTAHPKRDPDTGDLHAVSHSITRGNKVQYTVLTREGHMARSVDIEVGGSPMMHDFSLTENYVVFYDLPVTFDIRTAIDIDSTRRHQQPSSPSTPSGLFAAPGPIAAHTISPAPDRRYPYQWNPNYPARLGIMPREGSDTDVHWFDIDPCYVFHSMNAFDVGDIVILDVVRYSKVMDESRQGPGDGTPTLDRWTIDLPAGKVSQTRIDDRAQEFPRIDERLVGKPHRFGYVPTVGPDLIGDQTLIKHDFVGSRTLTRSFGRGKALGEFTFHPARADAAEDEGVLMGYVYDAISDRSDLAILDAETLESIATIHLPHRVPAGFHGNWIPTDGQPRYQ